MKKLIAATLLTALGATASASVIFEAELDTASVTTPPTTPLGASGKATLTLNDARTEVEYRIELSNEIFLSANPATETVANAVNKIHLHVAPLGTAGPHVLNIFGLPSEDDDDLVIAGNVLTGIWGDAGDTVGDPTSPGSTKALPGFLDDLLAGNIYVAVHTINSDSTVEIRGQFRAVAVPEPGSVVLTGLGLLALVGAGRRRRRA